MIISVHTEKTVQKYILVFSGVYLGNKKDTAFTFHYDSTKVSHTVSVAMALPHLDGFLVAPPNLYSRVLVSKHRKQV